MVDFMAHAKALGYEVIVVVIKVESTELNLARISQRVHAGGRNVPPEKVSTASLECLNTSGDTALRSGEGTRQLSHRCAISAHAYNQARCSRGSTDLQDRFICSLSGASTLWRHSKRQHPAECVQLSFEALLTITK